MEFPTIDEIAKEVAEKAFDEFTYEGKTIREWAEIIAKQQPCEDMEVIQVSKGALKSRQGRFVIYDVDWLKKNFYLEEKIYGQPKQPCEDAISREEAIRIAEQGQIQGYEWQFKKLCNLPSVTPKPKMGEWIYKNDNKLIASDMGYWQCSNCEEGKLLYESAYCPNCGADMRGDKDGNTNNKE